ncbi:hypothetical protein FB45DRAFT_1008634 [Roridomyces roridus]|uniref:Mid2 domain-containing protein n=1 Tax=Roridomyces roridus TaxID=1738132 RepID=A0AAD7B929_9AGAR|nr:hypothetical protein FB45DRAFT_1008634 [Roridomyces roridus]
MSSANLHRRSTLPIINTPIGSVSQCSPLQLTWAGGTAPYTVQVRTFPGNSQLALFSNVEDTTVTWSAVDAVVGAQLVLDLTDATRNTAGSASFRVSAGSGNACIGGTQSDGGSSAAGSTTTSSSSAASATAAQSTVSSSGISTSTSLLSTSSPAATSVAKDGSPATQRKSLPTGAIVGIVISVLFLLSLLSLFHWFRYRRRRRYYRHGIEAPVSFKSKAPLASEFLLPAGGSPVSAALPSALTRQASQVSTSNAVSTYAPTSTGATVPDRRSAVSARQEFLASEMRAMQEKMQLFNLEELELERTRGVPESNSGGGGRTSRIMRFVSRRAPKSNTTYTPSPASSQEALTGGDSDLESQLQVSRAQNDVLAARIRQLEEQMQSDWALGLSDEPPPGYEVDSVPVG